MAKRPPTDPMQKPQTVSIGTICRLLNLTEARISQLVRKNIIKREGHGKYLLIESVHGYIDYLKSLQATPSDVDERYEEARARKMAAAAEMAEMEARRRRGELIEFKDVSMSWAEAAVTFQSRMLNMVDKAAPELVLIENVPEAKRLLKHYVVDALNELSESEVSTNGDDSSSKQQPGG